MLQTRHTGNKKTYIKTDVAGYLYRYMCQVCVVAFLLFLPLLSSAISSTFLADRTAGCSPLVVNFTPAEPACGGCTYSWNFGTGSPVSSYSASSSFLTAGVHVVTLTVTSGATVSSSTQTITVYPSPTVSFTASDTAICPAKNVTFLNTSTNGSAGAATIKWTLGDGDTAITNSITHTYMVSGYYNVSLSVTNSQGCTKSLTKTTLVHVFNRPSVSFTQSSNILCDPPASILFTNTTLGTAPLTYQWRFGDGGNASTANPSHIYSNTGTYNVWLKITDGNGCIDSATGSSSINVGSVHASYTFTDSICAFAPVTFTNTSSTHTYRQWLFGDGTTASSMNASHIYTATGTYAVKLVAGYSPCIDTETHYVHIIGGPPGSYIATSDQPCAAPVRVKYASTAPAGTIVRWNFERTNFVTGDTVYRNYAVDSIIYITIIKTDPKYGCKDTLNIIDTLYDHIFRMSVDKDRGCAPLTVNFLASTFTTKPDGMLHPYPYGVDTVIWHMGEAGAMAGGLTTSYTYNDTGKYKVIAELHSNNGCVIYDSMIITAGIVPSANFSATPLHACKADTITFSAGNITGPIDSFIWDFGDFLTFSDTAQKKRTYTLPGTFTVTMTPCYYGCCGDTFVRHDYVVIDSPMAVMYRRFNCPIDRQMLFFDSSLGNDSRKWLFGDGDSSLLAYPAHTYSAAGTYGIELIAYDSVSGCIDRRKDTITVSDPHPNFTANITQLCSSDTIRFTATDTSTARLSFRWIIGLSVTPFADGRNYEHIFNAPGRYTVRMVSWDDNDCLDTITRTNYIVLGKPKAGHRPSAAAGCIPHTVTFTDTSQQVAGLTASGYRWDFGDGETAVTTAAAISHTYTAIGTYTVTEVVTNNIGCKDTVSSIIIVRKANPAFTVSTTQPCIGAVVSFNNTSTDIVSSSWTFGDGGTSTATSTTHSYADTGAYTISLTVTDINNCTSTLTYGGYIQTGKPQAAFTVVDSVSVCVPFLAQFYNASTGSATYNWTFGDGHSSLVPSPTNNYTIPGIYNAQLIVTSAYGCKDTANQTIKVYGYPGGFTYVPTNGCSPMNVHFTSSLVNVPNITWDFSDGVIITTSGSDTISHTYATPGAYVPKLILSDNAGCVASNIGTDTIKVSAIIAKFVSLPDTICPGTYFTLIDSSTSYWSPITIRTWTYDALTSTTPSPMHAINTPGTYPVHLEVRNSWGCIGIRDTSIYITGINPIEGDSVLCVGSTIYLGSNSTGGTWESSNPGVATIGSSTGIVTGVTTGTVRITYHALGCQIEKTLTIEPTPAAITGTLIVCSGKTTPLTNATTGGSWSSSDATIATVNTGGTVTGITGGTATITYKKGNCFVTATVTVNTSPDNVTGATQICSNTTTTMHNALTGGTWSSSNTAIVTINSSGIANGVAVGTATITYEVNGCQSTTTVTVNNTTPEISGILTACAGSSVTLSNAGTGGSWSSGDTTIASVNAANGTVTGKVAGSTPIIYSLGGGCRDTALFTVLPLPDAGTINGPAALCMGDSAMLTASVPSGTWSNSNGNITIDIGGKINAVAAGIDTVTYTVSGTQCTATTKKVITVHALPVVGIIINSGSFCMGVTVTLQIVPNTAGTWSSSNSAVAAIDSSTAVLTTLTTGITTITFTMAADTNGCRNSAFVQTGVIYPQFSVSHTIKHVQCYGYNDGSIALMVNGAQPIEYKWQNGSTVETITDLAAGIYPVVITQPATNCAITDSFRVIQPDSMNINATSIADTCALQKGSIRTEVSGGTAPYSFAWTSTKGNIPNDANISNLLSDSYSLTVTDAKGCNDTMTVPVAEGPCNIIVIYDVITPNGDGANDNWIIKGIEEYPNNTVQIFDKWGDVVYEKQGYKNDWYGQGIKNELPDGTYYYLVKLNEPSKTGGETEFAGSLLIKR